ncbi:MAG: hypothetical protein GX552_18320 [Chloroflexi bacterium]|nr:hypothetical protein [Chloroflexota bacterium]
MRRLMLDNDGSNFFGQSMTEDIEGSIAEAVRECAPNVTTYLLCAGAGRYYFPTQVADVVIPTTTMSSYNILIAAYARGEDPFGMFLRALKAAGKETLVTFRMNDVHNPDDPSGWNTSTFRKNHPDYIVDPEGARTKTGGWMAYCMDYSREPVQAFYLAVIREVIERYGDVIDGIQLDWMRFPRHLSGTPEEVWAKREALTGFTARVREALDAATVASGKRLLLSARVPTTPAGCRALGMDIGEWGRRELLDMLVLCPFLTTEWHMPVGDFRALMGQAAPPIYAGFDFGFGQQTHFPESLRGICSNLCDCGADGIYLFNFPCWIEYMAARPYHWLAGLEDPRTAATRPLLLAVDHTRHRVAGVDQVGQLPATLEMDKPLELTIYVPQAALPAWRGLLLVHSHGDIALAVNGQPGTALAPRRSELFAEFIPTGTGANARPAPADCRTFAIDPAWLQPGLNRLTLTNATPGPLVIERVNLGLW